MSEGPALSEPEDDLPEPEELVDKDEIDEDDEMELTGEELTEGPE